MSEEESLTSVNSYGRKTWNRDAYAKLARDKRSNNYNNYINNNVNNSNNNNDEKIDITKRKVNVDFESNLNKVQIVNQSSSVSVHRGKSSGFYCETCNLTFKDNLSFLNHINSTRHLENSEYKTSHLNNNITVEDVQKKLQAVYERKLREKEQGNDLEVFNLKRRIEERQKFEERETMRKKQKKMEKKQNKLEQKQRRKETDGGLGDKDGDDEIMKQMGFAGFSGTGKK